MEGHLTTFILFCHSLQSSSQLRRWSINCKRSPFFLLTAEYHELLWGSDLVQVQSTIYTTAKNFTSPEPCANVRAASTPSFGLFHNYWIENPFVFFIITILSLLELALATHVLYKLINLLLASFLILVLNSITVLLAQDNI